VVSLNLSIRLLELSRGDEIMAIDYNELGKRIAKRRKVLNWTQEETAEKAKMSTTHLRNIERANTKCSMEVMMRICNALNVTPDYLFLGTIKIENENFIESIIEKLKLCDSKQQLLLISNFISWIVDETYK